MSVWVVATVSELRKRYPLVGRYIIAQLVLVVMVIYLVVSFQRGWYFDWGMFFTLFGIVGCVNAGVLISARRNWHKIGVRRQILILDWAVAWGWYGICAPIYQSFTLTLNQQQLKVDAITYLWETTILGALAFIVTQVELTPVVNFLRTGHTQDPLKLYRLASRFPLRAIFRNSVASIVGYSLAAWQMRLFADLPMVEVYKNIGIGVILSVFVSIFYYLAFVSYLGPIKSRILNRYKLHDAIKTRYSNSAIAVIGMISVGSISLMILIYVQSMQIGIERQLRVGQQRDLDRLTESGQSTDAHDVDLLLQGERASMRVVEWGSADAGVKLAPETVRLIQSRSEGIVRDNAVEPKLISFKDVGYRRVIAVTYINDFYDILENTYKTMMYGAVMILAMITILITLFSQTLNRALDRLRRAVEGAQRTGEYVNPGITTGDEFELLSGAFQQFVEQTHEQNRQLAFEHTRLQASIDSLTQGFILTDAQGRILRWNLAVSKLLYGKSVDTPASLGAMTLALPQAAKALRQISQHIGHTSRSKLGKVQIGEKYLDIFVTPILEGGVALGAAVVIQDATESTLLDRSKDEFFSIASHELRTPLTVIRGNTSMMKDAYSSTLKRKPDMAEMVDDMHAASVGLIEIVNDFLDVSRLEQGKMSFVLTTFKLGDIAKQVGAEMEGLARVKGIRLKVDVPPTAADVMVRADAVRTRQVLYNLIGNAIKFTDHGGVIIAVRVVGHNLEVTVSDTGRGLPDDTKNLLFRKFQQANNNIFTRDTTRGTGLGLYISRLIMDKMGGKIYLVNAAAGKGSVFGFALPKHRNAPSKD